MKSVGSYLLLLSLWLLGPVALWGQSSSPETTAESSGTTTAPAGDAAAQANNTAAAAAIASGKVTAPQAPEFVEHLVDVILELFDIRSSGNTPARYAISGLVLVLAFVLRRVVTTIFFGILRRLASRTRTTLDDKLFPALESPVAMFIVVVGAMAALKVLKLSPTTDVTLSYLYTGAFSLVLFWMFLKGFGTVLDHLHEAAREKQMGIAAFMPWIKKTLIAVFVIFGVLMIAQSLGADVKAFLAGLGIGGLAFALAAQDTIANLFGSVVVATDQPFKVGETVQIGSHIGTVEDIGLRSTRLRTVQKSLLIIPNKTMASESIINLSRFTQRRVEQTIGLTYDAKPDQIETIVNEIRDIITGEPGVDKTSVIVHFTTFGSSSLDIWLLYNTTDPDFAKHLKLKEAINLKIMRAVEARGLSFAFPTQTVHLDGPVAKQLAARQG